MAPLDVAICSGNVATQTRTSGVPVDAMQVLVVVKSSACFTTFTGPRTTTPSLSLLPSLITPSTPKPDAVTASAQPSIPGKKIFSAGVIAGVVINPLAIILLVVAVFVFRCHKQKRGNIVQHGHSEFTRTHCDRNGISQLEDAKLSSSNNVPQADISSLSVQAHLDKIGPITQNHRHTYVSGVAHAEMSGTATAVSHSTSPNHSTYTSAER
jgi:hypothetical protein